MRIGDLDFQAVRTRLCRSGILFRSGPFLIRFRTGIPHLAKPFQLLYSDFDCLPTSLFSDFRIRIEPLPGIARWLRPQARILFDGRPMFAPFPARLSLAFLEWGQNWCIASQVCQYLVLHAAVLEKSGQAIIFAGPPGSGKSTLCAAMAQLGWRLLSDELTLVRPGDGQVVPMPRPVSLKNESITIVRQLFPEAVFGPMCPTARKGEITHLKPPKTSVEEARIPAAPRWVIFPGYDPGSAVELRRLPRSRAFLRLAESSFNYSYLGTAGFEMTAQLIRNCDCYRLSYGNVIDALREIDKVCS